MLSAKHVTPGSIVTFTYDRPDPPKKVADMTISWAARGDKTVTIVMPSDARELRPRTVMSRDADEWLKRRIA